MVFPNYLVFRQCDYFSETPKRLTFFFFFLFVFSVSDLLDYISPDQDSKGGDAQRKRRSKVMR